MTYYRFNYIKVTLFACDVVFVKIQNVLKRRRKSKLNGLGGRQVSGWVSFNMNSSGQFALMEEF